MTSARNLGLEAARRQRTIREAQIRIARPLQNPDVALEVSRDVPYEVLTFNVPIEIGGKRARRIDLARTEMAQSDIDVRVELRTLRRNLRQAFYGLLAAGERVRRHSLPEASAWRSRSAWIASESSASFAT